MAFKNYTSKLTPGEELFYFKDRSGEDGLPPESPRYHQDAKQTLRLEIKPLKEYEKFKKIINRVNDAAVRKMGTA